MNELPSDVEEIFLVQGPPDNKPAYADVHCNQQYSVLATGQVKQRLKSCQYNGNGLWN